MHPTSKIQMTKLVSTYLTDKNSVLNILDVGSYDVNGTYRPLFNQPGWKYTGVDIAAGPGVDIVLTNPYTFPFGSDYDLVVSGQAFEHIEFFWMTWQEMVRVLKPGGMIFLIAPTKFQEHRYPVDCWRFLPDGFTALARFSSIEILEVYSSPGGSNAQADTVGVFKKPIKK